ncbi:MAG: hypothetical protein HY893_01350 [Deltaproteobacteria bacterium]|nr:hypothetical protein [Deltaproteobacteria bacterium]
MMRKRRVVEAIEYDPTAASAVVQAPGGRGRDKVEIVEVLPLYEDIPVEPEEGLASGSGPIGNKKVRIIEKLYRHVAGTHLWNHVFGR